MNRTSKSTKDWTQANRLEKLIEEHENRLEELIKEHEQKLK